MKPVKLGEGPGRKSELIPSQALEPKGYGEGVLQPTNAVSSEAVAAKAEVGRKSPAARRAGSIPASGTNLEAAPAHAGAAFSFLSRALESPIASHEGFKHVRDERRRIDHLAVGLRV